LDLDGSAVSIDAKDAGSINIGTSTDVSSDTSPINVGTSASARTISIGNASSTALNLDADDINMSSASTMDLVSPALTVDANGTDANGITLDLKATNAGGAAFIDMSADRVKIDATAEFSEEAGISGVAGEALLKGRVCVFKNDAGTGKVYFATADATSDDERALHATTFMDGTANVDANYGGVAGTLSNLQFAGTAPAAADIGKVIYLHAAGATVADKGKVTLSAPTASGATVFKVGILRSATAVDTNYFPVMIQPQFIAKRP